MTKAEPLKSNDTETAPSKSDPSELEAEQRVVSEISTLSMQEESTIGPLDHSEISPKDVESSDESSTVEVEKKRRGRPPTRGKMATRGAAAMATTRRNVFESGTSSKPRGRKPGDNLLRIAMDTSKQSKLVGNRHLVRKLELQGREIAEGAPDPSAIGGLFDPSDMSSVPSIKPSTLRKSAASMAAPPNLSEQEKVASEQQIRSISSVPPLSNAPRLDPNRSVCFFWDREQKSARAPACANGYQCRYLHQYEFGVGVAAPPSNFNDNIDTEESHNMPHKTYNDYHTSVCYYWDRAQKDSGQRDCTKGAFCNYLHSYKVGAPIAAPPKYTFDINDVASDHDITLQSPSPRTKDTIVTEEALPPWRDRPQPIPVLTPTANTSSNATEVPAAKPSRPERPIWHPNIGNKSICYFWSQNGNCMKSHACNFYHSTDSRLAIAPSPTEQRKAMKNVVCPRLYTGDCKFGSKCAYSHERQPTTGDPPNDFGSSPHPLPSRDDDTAPAFPTNSGRKSVKFALDEPEKVFDEPATLSPTKEAWRSKEPREKPPTNYVLCRHYIKGYCWNGDRCEFSHEISSTRQGYEDTEMSMGFEPEDSGSHMDESSISRAGLYSQGAQNTSSSYSKADNAATKRAKAPSKDAVDNGPRRKVNLAQYNQQKTQKKIDARSKRVYFGQNETKPIVLDFGDIDGAADSLWKREFAAIDKVVFGQICIAHDFQLQQGYIQRRVIYHGRLVAADVESPDSAKAIEVVADELIARSAGLLASFPKFALLLFPASKEEWKYLEASSEFPKEGRLKYLVFETDWDMTKFQDGKITGMTFGQPYRRLLANMVHDMDIRQLIPPIGTSQDAHKYLMLFPPSDSHTLAFFENFAVRAKQRLQDI